MLRLVVILFLFSLTSFSCLADCRGTPSQLPNYADDTAFEKFDTDTGGCAITLNTDSRLIDMITSVSVIKKPRHGVVQIRDYVMLYWAVQGYQGEDEFSVKVCGKKGSGEGCSTLVYKPNMTEPSSQNVSQNAVSSALNGKIIDVTNENAGEQSKTKQTTATTEPRPVSKLDSSAVTLLERLAKLKADGAITVEEYDREKRKILGN